MKTSLRKYFSVFTLGFFLFSSALIIKPKFLTGDLNPTLKHCSSPSCSDGEIEVSVQNGFEPYNFKWFNLNEPNSILSISSKVEKLIPGTYCVEVEDLYGGEACECWNIKCCPSFNLNTLSISIQNPTDCEQSNGSLIITHINGPIGGTPPYTFILKDEEGNLFTHDSYNKFPNLKQGKYFLIITDSEGCSSQIVKMITSDDGFEIEQSSIIHTCNDQPIGSISLILNSSLEKYTFSWSNGFVENNTYVSTIDNLVPGNYCVTISDNINQQCDISECFEIINLSNGPLDLKTFIAQPCNSKTGAINVIMNNGKFPYTYSWSDNNNLNTSYRFGLNEGTYCVTVTDNCLNTGSKCFEIKKLTVDFTQTFNCNKTNIELNITGGQEPYRIQWSNGFKQAKLVDIDPGEYSVWVTDKSGCVVKKTIKAGSSSATILGIDGCAFELGMIQIDIVNYFHQIGTITIDGLQSIPIDNTKENSQYSFRANNGSHEILVNIGNCQYTKTISLNHTNGIEKFDEFNGSHCVYSSFCGANKVQYNTKSVIPAYRYSDVKANYWGKCEVDAYCNNNISGKISMPIIEMRGAELQAYLENFNSKIITQEDYALLEHRKQFAESFGNTPCVKLQVCPLNGETVARSIDSYVRQWYVEPLPNGCKKLYCGVLFPIYIKTICGKFIYWSDPVPEHCWPWTVEYLYHLVLWHGDMIGYYGATYTNSPLYNKIEKILAEADNDPYKLADLCGCTKISFCSNFDIVYTNEKSSTDVTKICDGTGNCIIYCDAEFESGLYPPGPFKPYFFLKKQNYSTRLLCDSSNNDRSNKLDYLLVSISENSQEIKGLINSAGKSYFYDYLPIDEERRLVHIGTSKPLALNTDKQQFISISSDSLGTAFNVLYQDTIMEWTKAIISDNDIKLNQHYFFDNKIYLIGENKGNLRINDNNVILDNSIRSYIFYLVLDTLGNLINSGKIKLANSDANNIRLINSSNNSNLILNKSNDNISLNGITINSTTSIILNLNNNSITNISNNNDLIFYSSNLSGNYKLSVEIVSQIQLNLITKFDSSVISNIPILLNNATINKIKYSENNFGEIITAIDFSGTINIEGINYNSNSINDIILLHFNKEGIFSRIYHFQADSKFELVDIKFIDSTVYVGSNAFFQGSDVHTKQFRFFSDCANTSQGIICAIDLDQFILNTIPPIQPMANESNLFQKGKFYIYPNPTNNAITIYKEDFFPSDFNIIVQNNQGQSVYFKHLKESDINRRCFVINTIDLMSGTYFICIKSKDQIVIQSQIIVIH